MLGTYSLFHPHLSVFSIAVTLDRGLKSSRTNLAGLFWGTFRRFIFFLVPMGLYDGIVQVLSHSPRAVVVIPLDEIEHLGSFTCSNI